MRERLLVEALTRPDGARRLQRAVEQSLAAPLLGRPAGSYRAVVHDGAIAGDPRIAVGPPGERAAPTSSR